VWHTLASSLVRNLLAYQNIPELPNGVPDEVPYRKNYAMTSVVRS